VKRVALDHPKLWKLADHLERCGVQAGLGLICATGLLERLWGFTARHATTGAIRFGPRQIAQGVAWPLDADAMIEALVDSGWLDRDPEGNPAEDTAGVPGGGLHGGREAILFVHGWSEHADKHVHRALVRALSDFADGTVPRVSEATDPERNRWFEVRGPRQEPRRAPAGVESQSQSRSQKPEKKRRRKPAPPAPLLVDPVDLAWEELLKTFDLYHRPRPREFDDERRRLVKQALEAQPKRGTAVLAHLAHGYRYLRRKWDDLDSHFTAETLLRKSHRAAYLDGYEMALAAGLRPPFAAEPKLPRPTDIDKPKTTRHVATAEETRADRERVRQEAERAPKEPCSTGCGAPSDTVFHRKVFCTPCAVKAAAETKGAA
jgi:hypothetical protein